jgi:hypothetical protein
LQAVEVDSVFAVSWRYFFGKSSPTTPIIRTGAKKLAAIAA